MRRAVPVLAATCLALAATAASAFDPFAAAAIEQKPDARAPLDRPLRDEAGRETTLRALGQGRPVLLVPVQHRCPNICGVTLAGLADALARQPFAAGRDFEVVAFGIDPREGPEEARATLSGLADGRGGGALPGFHATVAAPPEIAAVTDALGYHFAFDQRIGQYAHAAATAVLTADGRLARWIYGLAPEPEDLRLALTEAGQGRIGGWAEALLLLCYHYDPKTGRYTSLVREAIQVGGTATLLALALAIAIMIRRDRRRPGAVP